LNFSKIFETDFGVIPPGDPAMAAPRPVLGKEKPKFVRQFSWGCRRDPGAALGNVQDVAATWSRPIANVNPGWEIHVFPLCAALVNERPLQARERF